MGMARRRKRYKSVKPIISMFTFGLFGTLGFSPGGVLFNTFVNETEKYVQYAAIIALLVIVWFMAESVLKEVVISMMLQLKVLKIAPTWHPFIIQPISKAFMQ